MIEDIKPVNIDELPWKQARAFLISSGFNDSEIEEERTNRAVMLREAGADEQLIKEHFGEATTKNTEMFAAFTKENFEKYQDITDISKAFERGFGVSVSGLFANGKMPEQIPQDQLDMATRIASKIGTLAGDVPAMLVGATIGAASGGPVAPITSMGGAFALPEAMRGFLIDGYENGEFKSFKDFFERAAPVVYDTAKAFGVGAVSAVAGGVAGKAAGELGAVASVQATAQVGTEIAAMTAIGSALEGEIPKVEDFTDAAIIIFGLKGATMGASKLMRIYKATGLKPSEVVQRLDADPALKTEIASQNKYVPDSLTGKKPKDEIKVEFPKYEKGKLTNDPVVNEILEVVERPSEKQTLADFKAKAKEAFSVFKKDYVDRLDPIKQILDRIDPKDIAKNEYWLMRNTTNNDGIMAYMIEKGTIDFKTKLPVGESLKQITSEVGEKLPELKAYLIAKKAKNMIDRGMNPGVGLEIEKIDALVKKYDNDLKPYADRVYKWRDSILQYAVDSGVISKDVAKTFRDTDSNYVTFKRIVDAKEGGDGRVFGQPFKKLKGVDKDVLANIEDPLIATIENSRRIIEMAEDNLAKTEFVKRLSDVEGIEETGLLTKKKAQRQAIEVTSEEIVEALEKQGVDISDAEAFTIWRTKKVPLEKNEFLVYEKGKPVVYQTAEPIADAINNLRFSGGSENIIIGAMRAMARMQRAGITLAPNFMFNNAVRDILTASVFTKSATFPWKEYFGAFGSILKKDDLYWEFQKSGGASSSVFEISKLTYEQSLKNLKTETSLLDAATNVIKTPIEFLEMMGSVIETAPRLAEFKKQSGYKGDPLKREDLFKGAIGGREITIDFSKMGLKIQALNKITPFLSANIGGLSRTLEAAKADPKALAAKGFLYITVPSLILEIINQDDPRVEQQEDWVRDNFWLVATDNWVEAKSAAELAGVHEKLKTVIDGKAYINQGVVYKVPKPHELGMVFGTLPERAIRGIKQNDPKQAGVFLNSLVELLMPNLLPTAITAPTEIYFNKNLFTKQPIIPGHFETSNNGQKIYPEYWTKPYTSETAKAIGAIAGSFPLTKETAILSPVVVDHLMSSWGGNIARSISKGVDIVVDAMRAAEDVKRPEMVLSDVPFVGSLFARYPHLGLKPVKEFRELHEEFSKPMNTYKYLIKQRRFDEARKVFGEEITADEMVRLDGINKNIMETTSMIQSVASSPGMTPEDKRRIIDAMTMRVIMMAEYGANSYKEMRRSQKDLKR